MFISYCASSLKMHSSSTVIVSFPVFFSIQGSWNQWEMPHWSPGFKKQQADTWAGGSVQRWYWRSEACFWIICSISRLISVHFSTAYGSDIEEDVIGDTSGHFKKMLVVLLQVNSPNCSDKSVLQKHNVFTMCWFDGFRGPEMSREWLTQIWWSKMHK